MTSDNLRIGLLQTDLAWEQPEENMRRMEARMDAASPTDLILLPEMWATGFTMQPEWAAEKSPGPALTWMILEAVKRKTAIGGSLAIEVEGKYYNRFYCVHADGTFAQYDKHHLFSYGKEDQHYTPGDERILIEINGWKIMPVVCYDLRFPVWCRNTLDYDLMMVVANWPTARIHHWDALLKARAIENQSYIAAVNRIGKDGNGLEYPGHSSIYDMNGTQLLDLKGRDKLEVITIEKAPLAEFRDQFRFLQDRDSFIL